jgi:type II secretory pathway component HofQ
VIAGLMTNQDTESEKKVPFFGDIPVIGRAFTVKNLMTPCSRYVNWQNALKTNRR